MKSIIELGKQGSEHLELEVATPNALAEDNALRSIIETVRKFPHTTVPAETSDGIQRDVDVHVLPLANERVFGLAHSLAAYEPMVYTRIKGQTSLGMMSPNYDTEGVHRLPSLKVIPLAEAYPLSSRLLPNAEMATMLAGAVSAERAGIGSDERAGQDFEHQATILGAISLKDQSIATSHANHEVRAQGSAVATGLTNGKLGNLYAPDSAIGDFTGYGAPIVISARDVQPTDVMMIPDSFLSSAEAWGGNYDDAPRIMFGAGLRALHERQGDAEVTYQFQTLTERV